MRPCGLTLENSHAWVLRGCKNTQAYVAYFIFDAVIINLTNNFNPVKLRETILFNELI